MGGLSMRVQEQPPLPHLCIPWVTAKVLRRGVVLGGAYSQSSLVPWSGRPKDAGRAKHLRSERQQMKIRCLALPCVPVDLSEAVDGGVPCVPCTKAVDGGPAVSRV